MKTIIGAVIAIIVIALLIWLVYWISSQNATQAPATSQGGLSNGSTGTAQTAPMSATVTYTGSGFSPQTVSIAKGGTVTFQNGSSGDIRVASDPHPAHNGYPTTGGCTGSTFDSCSSIPPGGSWSFTFDYAGTWGYHNHLNAGQKGTVVVQ